MNKFIKNTIFGMMTAVVMMSSFANITFAQTTGTQDTPDNSNVEYTLLEPLPNLDGANQYKKTITFKEYVEYSFNLFIAISAAAAVFMIVFGGFQYMTTDSWKGKSEGLGKVKNALLGLLLVLGSYLLLRTIDPRLVNIPSTLVKPLEIRYEKVAESLINTIDKEISQFSKANQEILANLKNAREKIVGLQEQEKQIIKDITSLMYEDSIYDQDINQICNSGVVISNEILSKCTELYTNREEQKKVTVDIKHETAVGLINATIQECYVASKGSSYTSTSVCDQKMTDYALKYGKELQTMGEYGRAKQVSQYLSYGRATADMFDAVVTNISDSPTAKAFVDTYKEYAVPVVTAGGLILGGPVGGVAGYAATQVINNVIIDGIGSSIDVKEVQRAREGIINAYNKYSPIITDPATKELLKTQANSMLKNLGGQPIK